MIRESRETWKRSTDVLSVSALSLTSGREISFTQNGNNLEFDTNQFNDLAIGESETLVFAFSVSDDSGAENDTTSSTVTLLVEGRNDGPAISATNATVTLNEGDTATDNGSFDDVDLSDIVEITAINLDGSPIGTVTEDSGNSGDWSWLFDAVDGPVDSDTITIIAKDVLGATNQASFGLQVNNVAPVVTLSSNVGELVFVVGVSATFGGNFTDQGNQPRAQPQLAEVSPTCPPPPTIGGPSNLLRMHRSPRIRSIV